MKFDDIDWKNPDSTASIFPGYDFAIIKNSHIAYRMQYPDYKIRVLRSGEIVFDYSMTHFNYKEIGDLYDSVKRIKDHSEELKGVVIDVPEIEHKNLADMLGLKYLDLFSIVEHNMLPYLEEVVEYLKSVPYESISVYGNIDGSNTIELTTFKPIKEVRFGTVTIKGRSSQLGRI